MCVSDVHGRPSIKELVGWFVSKFVLVAPFPQFKILIICQGKDTKQLFLFSVWNSLLRLMRNNTTVKRII